MVVIVKSIELFEWDRGSTDANVLSKIERKTLIRFNESIRKRDNNDAITINYQGKIVTYSYVGIIQIGKKRIEILPKLFNGLNHDRFNTLDPTVIKNTRKNLLSILSFCGLIPVHKSAQSYYHHQKDFFEFLISIFLDDLEKALIAQLHREYISYENETPYLRGKLNLPKEMTKSPAKRHLFFCIYDEFSADNQFNQIIKSALKRIKGLCKYEDNRTRTDSLYIMMDEVSDSVITPQSFSKIRITRLNENYKEIIHFCKLILFGETISSDFGEENFYALIFDMNLVFERYCTRLLRNSFPYKYQFHYQEKLFLASDLKGKPKSKRNKRELYPDILVKLDNQQKTNNLAIIDTKYKLSLARDNSVAISDLYQMLAYCIASDTDKALLIYPTLPEQDSLNEKDYWIYLDKLAIEKENPEKMPEGQERVVHISARSVQILSQEGNRILHHLLDNDKEKIERLLIKN